MYTPVKSVWVLLAAAALAGCESQSQRQTLKEDAAADAALVERTFDQAAENAVVAEGAVYPHHFVANSAALNELGQQHAGVLATAWKTAPGKLVVVRGSASPDLYAARVKSVLSALEASGVDTSRVASDSALPGGPGISSPRAAKAFEGETESGPSRDGAPTGMTRTEPKP